jgi:ATP-dependent protease HslVU (ClpYQ) peptidase subunit
MTTIATDGKSMAGDGLVTGTEAICSKSFRKVRRLPDGRLVGVAGSAFQIEPFFAWLESGGEPPKLADDNFEALVLRPDGTCLCYDSECRSITEDLPTAIGSGRNFAIGALDAGLTAESAVQIACARDCRSGGLITVIHLEHKLEAVA